MKRATLAFFSSIFLISAFANQTGAIVQNTTDQPLDISYILCPYQGESSPVPCTQPSILHLEKHTSNYRSPIIDQQRNVILVHKVTSTDTGHVENFSGNSCIAALDDGVLTFSSIIDDPQEIICSSGTDKK